MFLLRPESRVRSCSAPIACLYKVKDFEEALALANDADYGLTASIHTDNFHRGVEFCKRVQAGVAVVNAGTYGSEPHMPFGGVKQSGNGSREPGTEAPGRVQRTEKYSDPHGCRTLVTLLCYTEFSFKGGPENVLSVLSGYVRMTEK